MGLEREAAWRLHLEIYPEDLLWEFLEICPEMGLSFHFPLGHSFL